MRQIPAVHRLPIFLALSALPWLAWATADGSDDGAHSSAAAAVRTTPPGAVIVDEEAAERALERSLVQAGGLLLQPRQLELEPSLVFSRREEVAPLLVEVNGEPLLLRQQHNLNDLSAGLAIRLGLPRDAQLELGLPYRWRRMEGVADADFSPVGATSASDSGVGNLRLGLAKTLLREGPRTPDLIARLSWDTRSGASGDEMALASDFHELRLSMTAITRQDPLVFIGGLAYEHVLERHGVRPGSAGTLSVGAFLAVSPQASMHFVLAQSYRGRTTRDGVSVRGSDQLASSFAIGGSMLMPGRALLNLSLVLGLTDDADDYAFQVSLPVRF